MRVGKYLQGGRAVGAEKGIGNEGRFRRLRRTLAAAHGWQNPFLER